jgi:hypothetical protein
MDYVQRLLFFISLIQTFIETLKVVHVVHDSNLSYQASSAERLKVQEGGGG